jgi:single-strand DNA-binding protein
MLNRQDIIGRTGKEVEVVTLQSGKKVAKVSIAVSEKYTVNGEKKEETTWFNIEAWDKLAEIFEKFVKKGDLIYVSGKTKVETYEKDGIKRQSTKIIVNQLTMLGGGEKTEKPESKPQQQNNNSVEDDSEQELPF